MNREERIDKLRKSYGYSSLLAPQALDYAEDLEDTVLKLQAENAELKRDINVYENALKKIEVDSGIALLGDDQHYNKPLK